VEFADLDESDVALFERAGAVLSAAHHAQRHQVAAAMRAGSGEIYVGLHLGSRRINVCAESSALASARIAGEDTITTAVAVCVGANDAITVTNPCGVCRELMGTYAPEAMVLLDVQGTVRKATVTDLMPLPWLRPEETGWAVHPPVPGSGR
jgi:cytidine deaminase